ncbi:hypothetical protein CANCADRAFT_57176 [Tortispora caseinolytica NRRL Y-17796]|uniref:Mmc1 C-terminal domain-containing protein n=1 Tax=Tortispora caseinolytica NRRL Y-17796 TaxID=767744 RepID=A0A1E4TGA5_9ASCO|nr:hypothetical protein CANCADRAFT_57176 [Tortispora caseinolytica NRRL Y-17796]
MFLSKRSCSNLARSARVLPRVLEKWPNVDSLHSRVKVLQQQLNQNATPRVAIIPYDAASKQSAKTLTKLLSADPLASEWPEFCNRFDSISYDEPISVDYGSQFVEPLKRIDDLSIHFTLPSSALSTMAVAYCPSIDTSLAQESTLHLLVGTSVNVLRHSNSTGYPTIMTIDGISANIPPAFTISTYKGAKAIDILLQSPSMASEFLQLEKESGLPELRARLTRSPASDLLDSIITTCEQFTVSDEQVGIQSQSSTEYLASLRTGWARDAHKELQTKLQPTLTKLHITYMPWWRLYTGMTTTLPVDMSDFLLDRFLPEASRRYDYILGKIDGFTLNKTTSLRPTMSLQIPEDQICENNPILKYHEKILTDDLDNLQLAAKKCLNNSLIGTAAISLPLAVALVCGIEELGFLDAAATLAAYVTVRRMVKSWDSALKDYSLKVDEAAKEAIYRGELDLYNRWEERIFEEKEINANQKEVLKLLKESD